VSRRLGLAVITLFIVSILVFAATQVLPGNTAKAILGRTASPAALARLNGQLGLNRGAVTQYLSWIGNVLRGNFGHSLVNQQSVASFVGPRLLNSAAIVLLAGVVGATVGVALGFLCALRRESVMDRIVTRSCLAAVAIPEFVVAVGLVLLLSARVVHVLPAISSFPPTDPVWSQGRLLVLPVLTLVIVVVPYLFRMTRAMMIEAFDSEYVEMARLKGVSESRIVIHHALPNVIGPIAQVLGLVLLYLAGGIVIVETVFAFPGVGQGLVNAVADRDVPVIQFLVLALSAFYLLVNIAVDAVVLVASPRARTTV
jgi:peptide/nickel transport system permease protein